MSGYVRQDVTNQISNGNTLDAIPLDGEFDALAAAFNATTGHTHGGGVGDGAPITVLGPAQNVSVTSTTIIPTVDNTISLGTPTKEFKDLYITGTANIGSLSADTVDINAGTIDNTSIGATTPSTGNFTTLTQNGLPVTLAANTQTLTNKTINFGNNTISASTPVLQGIGIQPLNSVLSALTSLPGTVGIVTTTGGLSFNVRNLSTDSNTGITIPDSDGFIGDLRVSGVTLTPEEWQPGVLTTNAVVSPSVLKNAVKDWQMNFAGVITLTSGSSYVLPVLDARTKRITVLGRDISLSGAVPIGIQVLNSSAQVATAGYVSSLSTITGATTSTITSTSGFIIGSNVAADTSTFQAILTRWGETNYWSCAVNGFKNSGASTYTGFGWIDQQTSQIRITSLTGSSFDGSGFFTVIQE
jgi:hypothetical protein